jgi:sugar fermentation stimulation protein A
VHCKQEHQVLKTPQFPPLHHPPAGALPWPELVPGTLIRRYKRFLADVRLDTGETVTAHCPNSGRMTGCAESGRPVYLSRHDSPKRKLKFTWELIDMPGSLVGVNTLVPNRLVAAAIAAGSVAELTGYDRVRPEVAVAPHTRIDICLQSPDRRDCYIEIKNCTLVEDGVAMFPDAVTARGVKHLQVLHRLAARGNRCGIFFLIQRMDAHRFAPAGHIDPAYAKALRTAVAGGVDVFVYDTIIDFTGICLGRPVPMRVPID